MLLTKVEDTQPLLSSSLVLEECETMLSTSVQASLNLEPTLTSSTVEEINKL